MTACIEERLLFLIRERPHEAQLCTAILAHKKRPEMQDAT